MAVAFPLYKYLIVVPFFKKEKVMDTVSPGNKKDFRGGEMERSMEC
ncbi:hypothetical protein lbkm_3902 [Lachnospiraceae bacterium KM106-2]|nr:hypothetical protein lbkm_3902 [Lachnospiraceae bacterium KM106-2]